MMQRSDQELSGIKDNGEWLLLQEELKAASHTIKVTREEGNLQVCVDLRKHPIWEPAVIVPCDDPFRLNISIKGVGAWVLKTTTPVSELVTGDEHLYVEMALMMERHTLACLVGKARWFLENETAEWKNYRTEMCLFGEVSDYKK